MKALFKILRHYPLTMAWFAFVYTVCLIPVPEVPVKPVVGFDKVVHLALWLVASGLIWWEYYRAPQSMRPRFPWVLTVALPILCSGSIELLQAYATTCRSGDWWDFLFNALGVLLAALGVGIITLRCRAK